MRDPSKGCPGTGLAHLSVLMFASDRIDWETTMADHLEALQRVVQEAIDTERLGQPQFVRCVARAPEGGSLDSSLEALASMGESWFGGPAASRTRRGEGSGVYLTEMSTWDTGQGALITVSATGGSGSADIDLMVVGSRGTLYHRA